MVQQDLGLNFLQELKQTKLHWAAVEFVPERLLLLKF